MYHDADEMDNLEACLAPSEEWQTGDSKNALGLHVLWIFASKGGMCGSGGPQSSERTPKIWLQNGGGRGFIAL